MLEFTALSAFIGYIIYLRYYADQRTNAQKEADRLREGINLYEDGKLIEALAYFTNAIERQPTSAVAYLYRARCKRALGDHQAALLDLNQGKSYDDTIAELHLETGQFHFDERDYSTAFQDFDKAIFYAHGETAEPYHWRGLVRQQLNQLQEAQHDLAKATMIKQQAATPKTTPEPRKRPFLDRQLGLHAGFVLVTSTLLVAIIKSSPVIHWPYLLAASVAVGIGFLEPRRGWVLALLQMLFLLLGYYVVAGPDPLNTHREVETFSLYGSIGLTFVGSLIGSVLRKAQADT